jgi:glutamate synthase (NADPH/NADH) large chain
VRQIFIAPGSPSLDQNAFERKLFVIRKQIEHTIRKMNAKGKEDFYIPSFSSRTIVYKGMLLSDQVGNFFPDLNDTRFVSAIALVHQRFSTNTFPRWELAHPFRMIAHNGEINTLRGNINWMAARRHAMQSDVLGEDLDKIWPLISEGQSDSACFDNALELLVMGGYSMGHAMMMLIPEAWDGNVLMDEQRRAFYEYHAALMEPWDGPAAVAFTDGRQIGATLDRNGLRPARYLITKDDNIIMASEMGVLTIPEENIVKKWRLQPGKMFLADLEEGRIIDDAELKATLASKKPYQEWLDNTQIKLVQLPDGISPMCPDENTLLDMQQAFGFTREDIDVILKPMVANALDPVGSMGSDTPPAVLSNQAKPLFDYFKQNFAQVTNPPIDPIREEIVMSLVSLIGPRPNLLGLNDAGQHKRLEVHHPILSNRDLERIRDIEFHSKGAFKTRTLSICYPVELGAAGMESALEKLNQQAQRAVEAGYNILILSDREVDATQIPIPALLATSSVHHHLINKGLRTVSGLVVETGAAREVHHFAMLGGYGAEAINPYLALDTLESMKAEFAQYSVNEIHARYIKGACKGLLKIMSKMGISTFQSYCGAQIFDAVGLATPFVEKYFRGTATTIEGIGLKEVAEEAFRWHSEAYGDQEEFRHQLPVGGNYAQRHRGEQHAWTSETISTLQSATRTNDYRTYQEYARLINDQSKNLKTFRGLFDFRFAQQAIPIEEVEPIEEIVKRFVTGAMSFGALSWEAHTTLALAMNKLGGKSNSGEGGEAPSRFKMQPDGSSMNSAIKQCASGRFGVTTEYLASGQEIQIKMAQGAKPGEGGQLPGHKVDSEIARVRHSTPGVGLISPPPHHDIYSIEDLAQLIHDLKNVNPSARISVKLVSEVGVGTVAAGVSKAHADHVTISGQDGGTAASPLASIKHAGSFWEMGLAETHQTLVLNNLRGRISVQVDGGLKTGRDVVVAALLGADEFGFSTAPLIVEGCLMMRKCHLNTCPAGVATQNKELRKRFSGKPEHVVNYFIMVAQEARELMAKLGFRTFNEMIGRSDRLEMKSLMDHWKAHGLDFSKVFYRPEVGPDVALYNCEKQDHGLDKALDLKVIEQTSAALENRQAVELNLQIKNINRSFGAMLSGEVAKRYGHAGLPDDTIVLNINGTAGQSFGAWLAHGITLKLDGEANDYVGKGLSGGKIVVKPAPDSPIVPEENIIAGNTLLYGAISGECYLRGVVGERFAVRNSGATAVVEGVGDHCCEYMTGGCVVVIGQIGRNFAAGMSGGIAYVLDENGDYEKRCNFEMVELETFEGDGENNTGMDIYANPLGDDAVRLKTLLKQHYQLTGSRKAQLILDQWSTYLPRFYKIVPVDYRRAMLEHAASVQKSAAGGQ